ncbi:MAG: hypothetical protein NC097_03980 [Clostridium sp.]|nr:hypothetical protein [Prevotella sp.]MCM1378131.1 hypothetical protein [Prevotella sp.]MCM1428935.1 hypothetical protein [Clostridium sp.]MCM1475969.1 hypothetical protein [Muribaculaceae bacterium]
MKNTNLPLLSSSILPRLSFSVLLAFSIGVVVVLSLLSACTSDKKTVDTPLDTAAPIVAESDTVVPSRPRYVLTAEGIGPVAPGMKTKTWPELAEGLYDSIEEGPGGEGDQYEFYLEGQPMVTVMDFGQGEADLVVVSDPSIKAKVGEVQLGLGDSFSKLLSQPGVRAEWEQLDEEGMWYWTTGGLWFAPAQDKLTPELSEKLYDPKRPPVSTDFPPEIGIGYIGTGLPF